MRYINQLPADQTFTDHLGDVNVSDPRNDVQFHRVMLNFRGWLGAPKLRYQITAWSVMSTNQTTLYVGGQKGTTVSVAMSVLF